MTLSLFLKSFKCLTAAVQSQWTNNIMIKYQICSNPVETTDLPILILSLQPFPPSQCWVRTWVMDCLQATHALSIAKGCSLQQCPQIILVARSISWSPSFSSWQMSQGQHLPQQGNLGKIPNFLCQHVEFGLYDPNVLNSCN